MQNFKLGRSTSVQSTLGRSALAALLLMVTLWPLGSMAALSETHLALIKVESSGMYRLSHADLLSAGVDLDGLPHNKITVSLNGEQLAVNSVGREIGDLRSNKFGSGGYIEFYVPAFSSLYSKQAALVLGFDTRTAYMGSEQVALNSSEAGQTTYRSKLELEKDTVYDFFSPAHNDPWHYGPVYAFSNNDVQGTSVPFDLTNLAGSRADIQAEFIGIIDIDSDGNDHHVVGLVNGAEVGDEQFDGNVAHTIEFNNVNVVASNTFQFAIRSIATTPYDAVALNKVTVKFDRATVAENDYLDGEFASNQTFELSHFTNEAINVYSVDDTSGDVSLVKRTRTNGNGTVKFKTNSAGGRYIAVADNGYKSVESIDALPVLADISSGSAEYLIIAHSDFIGTPELDAFVALRSASYSVKVVDVEQLYHQFSNLHVPSDAAISDYIRFAEENLDTQFVLFVGGDTYDYKHIKSTAKSFVPTQYVVTRGDGLTIRQAPSDAKYGDLDDDGVPDIPVGRFPVRTASELSNIVQKISAYEARVGYAGRIVMAADQADNGNGVSFTRDAISLIEAIPPAWAGSLRSDYRVLPDIDGAVPARNKLFNAVNAGVSVTAFIGHSSQVQWSRTTPALLTRAEIANFTNVDKPTVVTQWGCWNTYFVHPDGNSMAELFLNPGLNGAATVLGASTLTKASSEYLLASELNKVLYSEGMPIGTAVIKAKKALALIEPTASDVLLGWQILGDPALVVNN